MRRTITQTKKAKKDQRVQGEKECNIQSDTPPLVAFARAQGLAIAFFRKPPYQNPRFDICLSGPSFKHQKEMSTEFKASEQLISNS